MYEENKEMMENQNENQQPADQGNGAGVGALIGIGALLGAGITTWWFKTKDKRDAKREAKYAAFLIKRGKSVIDADYTELEKTSETETAE